MCALFFWLEISKSVAGQSDGKMIKAQISRAVLLEAHRQFAQAKRLGLGWDWPHAMRFAHAKIAGLRSTIKAQMAKIVAGVSSHEFKTSRYGLQKGK